MSEKEKDLNRTDKRESSPRKTATDEQKRKIGDAAIRLANKDKK